MKMAPPFYNGMSNSVNSDDSIQDTVLNALNYFIYYAAY